MLKSSKLNFVTIGLATVALACPLAACNNDPTGDDTGETGDTTDTGETETGPEPDLPPEQPEFRILSAVATPTSFIEGEAPEITVEVTYSLPPDEQEWTQHRGPHTQGPNHESGGAEDTVHTVSFELPDNFEIAADTELAFEIVATRGDVTEAETVVVHALWQDMVPSLGAGIQIGGASTSAASFDVDGVAWTLYNVGNRLVASPIGVSQAVHGLHVPGYIQDIEIVDYAGQTYALIAMGSDGIAVVDVSDPTMMTLVIDAIRVNFYEPMIHFAEGGGDILEEELFGTRGTITSLKTDGVTLWIGNADYGLHRTALANLLEPMPQLEDDGTLLIEAEAYILQYAGEHPWGGPSDIELVEGRLFVAQGQLGLGIYDPVTLAKVGYYNLFTDTTMVEDWFVGMHVANEVHDDGNGPFLDPGTGMPDYRQANFEIAQVWKGGVHAPTPWAEFDRYGKFYYDARKVSVAGQGQRSIAYVAYGLGGLIAVDVTGYQQATVDDFLLGTYLGYAPAIPAHGPESPSSAESRSLYPYHGAGMLKEAGVVDVAVDGTDVYYTDHFAGLVVLGGGDAPELNWHGPAAPYDNDDPQLGDGVLGDHWPDWEFVTSYDMSTFDPEDHDSLPLWLLDTPSRLVTGEVSGHGNRLILAQPLATATPGNVDVVQCAGAGGLNYLDIVDFDAPLMADRFALLEYFPTTDEIGAAPDGSPTATISIGHTQGVTATADYLYVGDGPHGVSAWALKDQDGVALDHIRLVANSIQFEDPVDVNGSRIYPPHHAWGTIYDAEREVIWSMSQSLGMRRVDVSMVEADLGAPGAPLLLALDEDDLFEHNGIFGVVDELRGQDHAYDVALDGELAFVADGSNGLTIYDVSKDPADLDSGFVVANIGGEKQQRPPLGRTVAIELWSDPEQPNSRYAFMAAGQRGVAVLDVADPAAMSFIKVFEPIKIEDGNVIHADSRAVDVHVVGDHVFFSYSGFGVIVYTIADLLAPLPDGVDPTEIWKHNEFDHRPQTVSEFRLHEQPGFEEVDAEALYMEYTHVGERLVFYVAHGHAGLVALDYSDPANPVLLQVVETVGEALSVALSNGRIYVADHEGGIAQFR